MSCPSDCSAAVFCPSGYKFQWTCGELQTLQRIGKELMALLKTSADKRTSSAIPRQVSNNTTGTKSSAVQDTEQGKVCEAILPSGDAPAFVTQQEEVIGVELAKSAPAPDRHLTQTPVLDDCQDGENADGTPGLADDEQEPDIPRDAPLLKEKKEQDIVMSNDKSAEPAHSPDDQVRADEAVTLQLSTEDSASPLANIALNNVPSSADEMEDETTEEQEDDEQEPDLVPFLSPSAPPMAEQDTSPNPEEARQMAPKKKRNSKKLKKQSAAARSEGAMSVQDGAPQLQTDEAVEPSASAPALATQRSLQEVFVPAPDKDDDQAPDPRYAPWLEECLHCSPSAQPASQHLQQNSRDKEVKLQQEEEEEVEDDDEQEVDDREPHQEENLSCANTGQNVVQETNERQQEKEKPQSRPVLCCRVSPDGCLIPLMMSFQQWRAWNWLDPDSTLSSSSLRRFQDERKTFVRHHHSTPPTFRCASRSPEEGNRDLRIFRRHYDGFRRTMPCLWLTSAMQDQRLLSHQDAENIEARFYIKGCIEANGLLFQCIFRHLDSSDVPHVKDLFLAEGPPCVKATLKNCPGSACNACTSEYLHSDG